MTMRKASFAVVIFLLFGCTFMLAGCATQPDTAPVTDQQKPGRLVAIDSISSSETDEATFVTITADGPLTFSSFKKPDPPAVVLIFPATATNRLPSDPDLSSELIDSVVVSEGNDGQTARVEFQLTADATYSASRDGDKVRLTFNRPPERAAEMAEQTPAPIPEAQPVATAPESSQAPGPKADLSGKPAADIPKTTAWVNKVDFLSESEGKSTLVLGTTHAVAYRINKVGPKKLKCNC
jgi:hypothetical protein